MKPKIKIKVAFVSIMKATLILKVPFMMFRKLLAKFNEHLVPKAF